MHLTNLSGSTFSCFLLTSITVKLNQKSLSCWLEICEVAINAEEKQTVKTVCEYEAVPHVIHTTLLLTKTPAFTVLSCPAGNLNTVTMLLISHSPKLSQRLMWFLHFPLNQNVSFSQILTNVRHELNHCSNRHIWQQVKLQPVFSRTHTAFLLY